MVFTFWHSVLTPSGQTRSWCVPFNWNPSRYFGPFWWHILEQSWKAVATTSPCFRPFWIGNASDRILHMWISLQVSLKHFLISLSNLIGISNSMTVSYNTSLLSHRPSGNLWIPDVLPHCTPNFFQYLAKTKYMISSWSVMPKSTSMFTSNLFYIWN
jgi:hypothetical protein